MQSGRSVLITGCHGGIGLALVRAFSQQGWYVVGTDIQPLAVSPTDAFVEADLLAVAKDEAYADDFAARVRAALNGKPLGCLVNNAALQVVAPVEELTTQQFAASLLTNVVAPFALVKAFLGDLEAQQGSVVNIGSVHAQATKPEFSAYSTSKAALHGLTRGLAIELGAKVRINTLAPGAVATPMLVAGFEGKAQAFADLNSCQPVGRIAQPEEVAKVAVFLASSDAEFITGATLYMDGGILSRLHDPS